MEHPKYGATFWVVIEFGQCKRLEGSVEVVGDFWEYSVTRKGVEERPDNQPGDN